MTRRFAQAVVIVMAILIVGAELAESEALNPTTAELQQ